MRLASRYNNKVTKRRSPWSPNRRLNKLQRRIIVIVAGVWLIRFIFVQEKYHHLQNDQIIPTTETNPDFSSIQRTPQQRLIILAGPHKTGTSSMQTNLWKWSTNAESTDSGSSVLPNWSWPVPPPIVQIESSDPHPWPWTPAKGFYPLLEALRHPRYQTPKRSLFQQLNPHQIVQMYTVHLQKVLSEGHDIIMGTEAMDLLVKDFDGPRILHNLTTEVLPHDTITGDSVDVNLVIVYRTPKASHLISVWHQNTLKKTDPGFYDWITTTGNELGALDALGMVDLVLTHTDWNVVLVDVSGVKKNGWDLSNLIACEVMLVPCVNNRVLGLNEDPIRANVRENQRPPDVSDKVLESMEDVLRGYDCNYQYLFGEVYRQRLKILHSLNIMDIIESCKQRAKYPSTRKEMKQQVVEIALAAKPHRDKTGDNAVERR